jgi:hypothetical protein
MPTSGLARKLLYAPQLLLLWHAPQVVGRLRADISEKTCNPVTVITDKDHR